MTLIADVGPGDPGESTWANAIRDQTVQVTTSGSMPGTPAEGMVVAVTNRDRLELYSGSAWVPGPNWSSTGRVGGRWRRTSGQSIGTAGTVITWDTEDIDTDGFWSSGANIVVPSGLAGLYAIHCSALFDGTGPGSDASYCLLTHIPSGGSEVALSRVPIPNVAFGGASCSIVRPLGVGDAVRCVLEQGSGSGKTTGASSGATTLPASPVIELWRISA